MGLFGTSLLLMGGMANAASKSANSTSNALYNVIQNIRTNRDIRKVMQQASEFNHTSRAVEIMPNLNTNQLLLESGDDKDVYLCPTQGQKIQDIALGFIWGNSDEPDSCVVSGGKPEMRAEAMIPFIHKLQDAKPPARPVPIVVLHAGNKDLETVIDNHSVFHETIGGGKTYYDTFRGLPAEDIASILYETMRDASIKPSAEALLRAVVEMALRKNGAVNLKTLASYPVQELMDDLDAMKLSNQISLIDYTKISRDYMSGTSEIDAVRMFLYKLNRQAENVFGRPSNLRCNLKKSINLGGVESFDIGTGNNELLVNLILNHLLYYQEAGKSFAILVDGIPVGKFEQFSNLLSGSVFAIGHQDVISAIFAGQNKGEDFFVEIMGNVGATVLFNHKSSKSCQRWSDYIGTYHKIKVRMAISKSTAFQSFSDNRGLQVEETDEPRIRAETLSLLPGSTACIHRPEGILITEIL